MLSAKQYDLQHIKNIHIYAGKVSSKGIYQRDPDPRFFLLIIIFLCVNLVQIILLAPQTYIAYKAKLST